MQIIKALDIVWHLCDHLEGLKPVTTICNLSTSIPTYWTMPKVFGLQLHRMKEENAKRVIWIGASTKVLHHIYQFLIVSPWPYLFHQHDRGKLTAVRSFTIFWIIFNGLPDNFNLLPTKPPIVIPIINLFQYVFAVRLWNLQWVFLQT